MRRLAPWLVIGVLSGCASMTAAQGDGPPQVLFTSAMCDDRAQAPRLTWVGNAAGLRHLMGRLDAQPPMTDFSRRAALLLEMGMQSSPGYGLTLQPGRWRISGDTLLLHVNWLTPLPGRVYPQVIAHPCLLISVPRGGYSHIEVRDQQGTLRMQGNVLDKR